MAEENFKQLKDEIIKHFDEKTEETHRHFDVVAEDLKVKFKPFLNRWAQIPKKWK